MIRTMYGVFFPDDENTFTAHVCAAIEAIRNGSSFVRNEKGQNISPKYGENRGVVSAFPKVYFRPDYGCWVRAETFSEMVEKGIVFQNYDHLKASLAVSGIVAIRHEGDRVSVDGNIYKFEKLDGDKFKISPFSKNVIYRVQLRNGVTIKDFKTIAAAKDFEYELEGGVNIVCVSEGI